MKDINWENLKELAQKATPGQWEHICQGSSEYIENSKHFTIASVVDHDNAAYIAAASPDVVLTLLERIEQLEKEADWLAQALVDRGHIIGDITSEHLHLPWRDAARNSMLHRRTSPDTQ